jgi:tagaturonate epimerase
MSRLLSLEKYSVGVGDRFGRQAEPQLRACMRAAEEGVQITPVWNKSNREHTIIGSDPALTRAAADAAIASLGWKKPYRVDADHIRMQTVQRYLPYADFFTLDVADTIGKAAPEAALDQFVSSHPELTGKIEIPGLTEPMTSSPRMLNTIAAKYLLAIQEAGELYRHIAAAKDAAAFITEVSMDETDAPQQPLDLLVILAGLADQKIPLQTIAPKFTGRFNKGVDYVGDVKKFEQEFRDDLAVIAFAVRQYGLPAALKLSVHSGSDKFSIYGPMARALKELDAGVHLKTAGTTWLEELIGLAEAGGRGLDIARKVYAEALDHMAELCVPYANVIDIAPNRLPTVSAVNGWSGEQFAAALRHDQSNPAYNPHFRQLLHVGFKIAARMGKEYLDALDEFEPYVSRNVTQNLWERHLKPVFIRGATPKTTTQKREAAYAVS